MWLPRHGRRSPPPALLPSLDRLGELVERVVDLLDRRTTATPVPEPVAVTVTMREPEPVSEPEVPEPEPAPPRPVEERDEQGWVAFVDSPGGYRFEPQQGPAPGAGATVELAGGRFRVLRVGPSPLPADARRCAFLAREERPTAERTLDP